MPGCKDVKGLVEEVDHLYAYRLMGKQSRHRSGIQLDKRGTGPSPVLTTEVLLEHC